MSIGSHCSTGFFRWIFQSRLLCQGMSQVISNRLTSSGENKKSWLIMMLSKRSLTTGWEHFRTVGFHLEKAGFLGEPEENHNRGSKKNKAKKDPVSRMWSKCDNYYFVSEVPASPRWKEWHAGHVLPANLVSEHEFLDYRWVDQFLQSTFFDESLLSTSSAFSSSYMLVNASYWNVVKSDGNKKRKKSFGASSARVCSKASCGLASQINGGKKKHGTRDRWPKKTGLRQRGRSPISFSSRTSVVDRKEMRNALLIMSLCIVHM